MGLERNFGSEDFKTQQQEIRKRFSPELQAVANRLKESGLQIFCYFDNTAYDLAGLPGHPVIEVGTLDEKGEWHKNLTFEQQNENSPITVQATRKPQLDNQVHITTQQ